METRIIELSANDLQTVLEIQEECGLSKWSDEDYHDELEREDSIKLVARQGGIRSGFLIMRLIMSNNEAELCNIGIHKRSLRKGIGTSLIRQAIELCNLKNIETIWLEVRRSNKNAINFYRSNGFQVIGQRKNFYQLPDEDAILMKLSTKAWKTGELTLD